MTKLNDCLEIVVLGHDDKNVKNYVARTTRAAVRFLGRTNLNKHKCRRITNIVHPYTIVPTAQSPMGKINIYALKLSDVISEPSFSYLNGEILSSRPYRYKLTYICICRAPSFNSVIV